MFRNMSERGMEMRQVKCRNCGTFINRDSAISVQNNKAKLWYCNEDCLKQYQDRKIAAQKEQAEKDAIYNEICSIFNYKLTNTTLYKEWAIWNQVADNEKILAYLKENHDYIAGAIRRLTSSEYAKIRYLSAVLKNSLHDYKTKVSEEKSKPKVEQNVTFYDFSTVTSKRNRRALDDLEDDV